MRGYCLAVRIGGLLIVALLGGLIVVPIACSNGTSKSGSGGTALDMKEIDKSKDTSKAQMGAGANDPDQKKYMKNGGDTGKAPDLRLPPSADAAQRPGNDHNAKLNAPPPIPLAATTGGGRSPLSGKGDPKSERRPDQPPQVWHRDAAGRPSPASTSATATRSNWCQPERHRHRRGARARTVVDHIFHNPHNRQLEGTFEYPLPTGASPPATSPCSSARRATPSRRASPAGGDNLPCPPTHSPRLTPEQSSSTSTPPTGAACRKPLVAAEGPRNLRGNRSRPDRPALLEYAGGNTFRGRVFPIPPKGYNRVLIAYEELLPVAREQMLYRFPLPDCKLKELQLHPPANAGVPGPVFQPDDADKDEGGGLLPSPRPGRERPGRRGVFAFTPPSRRSRHQRPAGRNGPLYFYARVRPDLKVEKATPFAHHAVFLLDTSLSEHPDRFGVNMKLLRKILESDTNIKHFNMLTFNVGAAWVEPGLDRQHGGRPERSSRGSTAWCWKARPISRRPWTNWCSRASTSTAGTPLNVFLLSDGQITWGETDSPPGGALRGTCPYRDALPLLSHRHRGRQSGAVRGADSQGRRHFQLLTARPIWPPRPRLIAASACRCRACASWRSGGRAMCWSPAARRRSIPAAI